MKELAAEEYEKLRVLDESFLSVVVPILGCSVLWIWWWLKVGVGAICCKGVALRIVVGSEEGCGCGCGVWFKGALLKRAWPVLVRPRREITLLNLETATSATALQSLSIWFGFEGEEEEEELYC